MDIIRKNNITGDFRIDELVYIFNGVHDNKDDKKPENCDAQKGQELMNDVEINPFHRSVKLLRALRKREEKSLFSLWLTAYIDTLCERTDP